MEHLENVNNTCNIIAILYFATHAVASGEPPAMRCQGGQPSNEACVGSSKNGVLKFCGEKALLIKQQLCKHYDVQILCLVFVV